MCQGSYRAIILTPLKEDLYRETPRELLGRIFDTRCLVQEGYSIDLPAAE